VVFFCLKAFGLLSFPPVSINLGDLEIHVITFMP
jgi:hypothetical protein